MPSHTVSIIGYAYDAAIHCPSCTRKDWNRDYFSYEFTYPYHAPDPDQHGLPMDLKDRDGVRVTPVFTTDEPGDGGDYCDYCRRNLRE